MHTHLTFSKRAISTRVDCSGIYKHHDFWNVKNACAMRQMEKWNSCDFNEEFREFIFVFDWEKNWLRTIIAKMKRFEVSQLDELKKKRLNKIKARNSDPFTFNLNTMQNMHTHAIYNWLLDFVCACASFLSKLFKIWDHNRRMISCKESRIDHDSIKRHYYVLQMSQNGQFWLLQHSSGQMCCCISFCQPCDICTINWLK